MPCEDSGGEETHPAVRGETEEGDQDEDGVGHVEQDVGEVMAPGIETEHVGIDHVGDPGERVPVEVIVGEESPLEAGSGEAAIDVAVEEDVEIVVEVNEAVGGGAPENEERGRGEG